MLLDFAIYNPLYDPETHTTIRACVAGDGAIKSKRSTALASSSTSCPVVNNKTQVTLEYQSWGPSSSNEASEVITAAEQVKSYLEDANNCATTFSWGYFGDVVVGVYWGSGIQNTDTALVVQMLIDSVSENGTPSRATVQYCGSSDLYTF